VTTKSFIILGLVPWTVDFHFPWLEHLILLYFIYSVFVLLEILLVLTEING